jgi:hypothetical protein
MSAQENEIAAQANGAAAPKKAKAEVTVVQMEDGSTQEFPGKRKMNKDTTIEGDTVTLHLGFRNGTIRNIVLPPSLITKFAAHGAEQKYGDELAGMKPAEGQEEVDTEDMVLEIDRLDENIQKGLWSTRKEGDGLGGTSVLIKALMEYGGKPLEVVKKFLSDKDTKFKLALRHDEVHRNKAGHSMAEIVKRIELEKASKGVKIDTSAALNDLDAMEASAV